MARAKNTGRADARRRYRDEHRSVEVEPNTLTGDVTGSEAEPAQRAGGLGGFRMPDVAADVRALPGMFLAKPLLWLPFGMLALGFLIIVAAVNEWLPEGIIRDGAGAYASMVVQPPSLIVPFIGGFLAPRASWLVGLLLGITYAALFTAVDAFASSATATVAATPEAGGNPFTLWAMSIFFGTLAGGFAAWYRGFLRSSQERARANRMQREKDQAAKAKEQARQDRDALKAASRTSGGSAAVGSSKGKST